jgi:hypothetical protein
LKEGLTALSGIMIRSRIIVPVFLLLFIPFSGAAQQKQFKVPDYQGEVMHYKLKYSIFNIGSATISCLDDPSGCGHRITAEARSDGLMRLFMNLHYQLECCMDPASGLPLYSVIDLKDGRNIFHNELEFDRGSGTDSTIILSRMTGKHVLPGNIFDILTGFYHYRMNCITGHAKSGSETVIRTFYPDKPWDLRIRWAGTENLETAFGQMACYRVHPVTVVGKYFYNEDDMTIWFTRDEFHIPVQIGLNLKFGGIHGELVQYENPRQKVL